MERATFAIDPAPPFRLDLTAWALRRRSHNAIDRWDGRIYRRLLVVASEPVEVAVEQIGPPEAPRLRVAVAGARLPPEVESRVNERLARLLGLGVDLTAFYRLASADARLHALAERFRGFRPPRFPTLFETLLNAIACQQITLTLGIHLLNRLASACGPAYAGDLHALPRPEDLVEHDSDNLRALGYSVQKARAAIAAARAALEGGLEETELAALDDAAAVERLRRLHGVGRWTAEYVLLRGLGRLHVFPGDDVGARNNLRTWLGMPEPLDYEGVRRVLAPWRPYGGVIYMHLLLDRLAAAGTL